MPHQTMSAQTPLAVRALGMVILLIGITLVIGASGWRCRMGRSFAA